METVETGSTPVMHSEFRSDLTVMADESLESAMELETKNKRSHMNTGTKLNVSAKMSVTIKVSFVIVIVGLLGFGAGPVPSLA